MASEMNKLCPFMVDKDTRLDNTVGGIGKNFTYNYTLVNYTAEQIQIDQLVSVMKPRMVNMVKTNPDMKEFRKNKITIIYSYKDKNGRFLKNIEITPNDYKGWENGQSVH